MEPRRPFPHDRYEFLRLLATGGMGQVWCARDTLLRRDVAVKVLRSEFTGNPAFLARFRAEARHTAALAHPNIAALYDYGEIEPGPDGLGEHVAYLVMEFVDGEPLSALLAREGRLAPDRALGLLRQAAAGLAAAHAAGVVHRDVKPANLLVRRDGMVKVTDFGVASSTSSVALTLTGQVIGTAHYLSPEQAAGERATPASDVYALGMVAFECLAGRRAFDGENSVQIALKHLREVPPPLPADVPWAIRDLVQRALARNPAARLADGAAFRDAVDAVLRGEPVPPPASPPTAVLPTGSVPALPQPATGSVPALPQPASPVDPMLRPAADIPVDTPIPAALDALLAEPEGLPAGRRSLPRLRRTPVLVTALALLTLGAGLLAMLLRAPDAEPSRATGPAAHQARVPAPSVSSVRIVGADYAGRQVTEVQAQLAGLGLRVGVRWITTGDLPAGQVIAVDPTGELPAGFVVTVTAAAPVAPPTAEPGPRYTQVAAPAGASVGPAEVQVVERAASVDPATATATTPAPPPPTPPPTPAGMTSDSSGGSRTGESGNSGKGASGKGAPGKGASGKGGSGKGASGKGASGKGASGKG